MKCPACAAEVGPPSGRLRSGAEVDFPIYDCNSCGTRFARHDAAAYEELHSSAGSTYEVQRRLGEQAAVAFSSGDRRQLRRLLTSASPKYRFVIEQIEGRPDLRRLLEVGCSKGYLSSYFISSGYDVLGSDISSSAVAEANSLFGDHFVTWDADVVAGRQPYDGIVHVGTIGCVADPRAFTEELLGMIRPGGLLVFNAPNVDACRATGDVWGATTTPPDLVTLFSPSYWERFLDLAEVSIRTTAIDPYPALLRVLRRGVPARRPSAALGAGPRAGGSATSRVRHGAQLGARAFAAGLAALGMLPRPPAEFGVFVVMTRRAS